MPFTNNVRFRLRHWCQRAKAAVNSPQSRRFAHFKDARPSRSVWTAVALAPLFRGRAAIICSGRNPGMKGKLNSAVLVLSVIAALGVFAAAVRAQQNVAGHADNFFSVEYF